MTRREVIKDNIFLQEDNYPEDSLTAQWDYFA